MIDKSQIAKEVKMWFHETPVSVQELFLSHNKLQLVLFHNTLGRYIRNNFNLWETKWTPELLNEIDISPDHPDQLSMNIIETVWEELKNEN